MGTKKDKNKSFLNIDPASYVLSTYKTHLVKCVEYEKIQEKIEKAPKTPKRKHEEDKNKCEDNWGEGKEKRKKLNPHKCTQQAVYFQDSRKLKLVESNHVDLSIMIEGGKLNDNIVEALMHAFFVKHKVKKAYFLE
jgi:hypothetical protein